MSGVVTTRADEFFTAQSAAMTAEDALDDAVARAVGVDPDDVDAWWWDDLSFDPVDWDGASVEFKGCRPEPPSLTSDQIEALWGLGFTVIRIFVKGSTKLSGDWWLVKGMPAPFQCRCPKVAGTGVAS